MMMDSAPRKIGFWSVFALVIGSQIGSGVFMSPTTLAPYGMYSIAGWLLSGCGAVALALVFAQLCAWLPKTGGPHVYVQQAFGHCAAFFTGWTYWVISWISTTVVIIASIGYLTPLMGIQSPLVNTSLEIFLLIAVTALNFRGISAAGHIEFLLTLLKIIPLCIIPLIALFYFDIHNFTVASTVTTLSLSQILSRVTLLTLWGFIGLESATAPAGSVENPSKTIPLAIVTGTICVALVYVLNSLALMGIIPGAQLINSPAPYADASQIIFGGNWHLMISAIASIICIGTLNAWILTSSQIALGLSQDRLVPAFFGYKNKHDAPYWGLIMSCVGIIPLLILTADKSIASQVLTIIDFSVTAFLFVYIVCSCAFFKILLQKKDTFTRRTLILLATYGCIALIFCGWVIYETPVNIILTASLFTLSGVPLYLLFHRKQKRVTS